MILLKGKDNKKVTVTRITQKDGAVFPIFELNDGTILYPVYSETIGIACWATEEEYERMIKTPPRKKWWQF